MILYIKKPADGSFFLFANFNYKWRYKTQITDLVIKKENRRVIVYVVKRFLQAGIEYNQILATACAIKVYFGANSEDAAEELVKNYLASHESVNGRYLSTAFSQIHFIIFTVCIIETLLLPFKLFSLYS